MSDKIKQIRQQLVVLEANQVELDAQIAKVEQSMKRNNAVVREMITANASCEQVHAHSIELHDQLNIAIEIVREKLKEAGF